MTSEHSDFLFFNHQDEPLNEVVPTEFWDILIVDDDPEIHSVTKLALSGVEFWGKGLRFHHAYSAVEGIEVLSKAPNVSVLLLDVVMESDDAGLKMVKEVRETLKNHNVRIILRTGQPGYAPEEQVIREYDINDYKTKTELTRSKLVTSLITAIRSYEQVCQLEAQSKALNNILCASKAILGFTDIKAFTMAVIKQLSVILDCEATGVVCGTLDDSNRISVLGGSTQFSAFFSQGIEQLDNGRIILQVQNCFEYEEHQHTKHDTTLLLKSKSRQAAIYLEYVSQPSNAQLQFAEIFLTNVSVGLDNVRLFNNLRDAAFKDVLTGLSNRTYFTEQIEKYHRLTNNDHVFVLIDVAHFSDINNGLGQEVGNNLLVAIVERLKQEYPAAKLLSRIGADVFGFLIEQQGFDQTELYDNLNLPFAAAEHILPVTFKIGICEQKDFQAIGIETLKLAYIALNQAKKGKYNTAVCYTPDMEEQMAWRLGIIRQLRQDFEHNKLEVWYQPQFTLNDLALIGCEALLRWPSGQGNYISPAIFIPFAEDAGLIVGIGQWVLEQACMQQKRLEATGVEICIAVNVSVPQFKVKGFAQQVKNTLLKYHVKPKNIELEVTESVVMDEMNAVIETLQELKEFGIQVAIDDFGTGFSSLSYLQKLPIDRLKIDRTFIKDLPEKDSGAIAALVVALGAQLGLKTIAEGVETQEQADLLRELGCDEVQGFMYAKPMPEAQLIQYFESKS
ncbi:EAL domain-containing protein [Pseudoalteromonas sp. NEC-BIFX-2020_002]|uniref:bifunctional diguanylate cyclase/phosphodiesterase n=1 Tax=Pseudoalteromonas sp. NEC-BIFX-2020_002 TaxID=2732353 RepID=UPI0014775FCF|nr:EAL domain-containing protein [Pseudoalteromonas sp. NEC-BIFX-2020_002]NNG44496.1 EAL domain-containing protein [Pseudoalteromonas sp. NEC-BIFX-2020_002]